MRVVASAARSPAEAGVEATRGALEGTARASIPDLAERLRELAPLLLFPKYRSEGLRELLTRYVPDMTLRGDLDAAGQARRRPELPAQCRRPGGDEGVASTTFQ